MELKIVEKNDRILLSRTEIKAEAVFTEAVPSNDSIKKSLASQLKVDEKLVLVKNIYPKFKNHKADVLAYCYLNEEDMKKIEQKNKKKKGKKGKKKAEETKEAPKEAPKKEKKKEAPKEEKKQEPKKEETKKEEKLVPKEEGK